MTFPLHSPRGTFPAIVISSYTHALGNDTIAILDICNIESLVLEHAIAQNVHGASYCLRAL